MAFLFCDSFDHYATADVASKYTVVSGVVSIQATGGRRGSGCARTTGGSDEFEISLTPGDNTVVVGLSMKHSTISSSEMLLIRKSGNNQCILKLNADGSISFNRGSSTVLGTTAAGLITSGNTYYIELKALISTTVGTAIIRINGAQVLSLTGLNNAGNGTSDWGTLKFNGNGGITKDYDDLYLLDGTGAAPLNTFLGDVRVDARFPTAEGANSAWTPSTGSDNALMVDDPAPNSDTDFNSTVTVNAVDTHVVQDAPVAGATIYAVQQCTYMKKTDAGTTSVAAVVRSGGTDYVQPTVNPTTAYKYYLQPLPTDPNTSAAWTEAKFNAAEFGYKRIA